VAQKESGRRNRRPAFQVAHDFYAAAVLEGFCKGELAMWMIILGALLILAAAMGESAYRSVSTVRATVSEVISLLALAGAAGFMLFDVGPRFKELYIGFGAEVPVVTVWAIRVLDFVHFGGIFLIASLIGLGVVGGVSFYRAHRRQETRRSARLFSLIANSLVGILIVLFTAAILLPFPRLLESLS
jgi:uncharacterized membrane-anchored protein